MANATAIKTSKKAHHMPALKIVDTTLQPGKMLMAGANRKNNGILFILFVCRANKNIMP
jgi:hypothetical protein